MNSQDPRRVISLNRPVGGAIIDADGREIPITETMIRRACRELDKQWIAAAKRPGKSAAIPESRPAP
jgi:hypothetical protein